MLVLLAVTLMSDAFYFIPRATLAAIIIVAMFSLMEINIVKTMWRNSSKSLSIYLQLSGFKTKKRTHFTSGADNALVKGLRTVKGVRWWWWSLSIRRPVYSFDPPYNIQSLMFAFIFKSKLLVVLLWVFFFSSTYSTRRT